VRDFRSTELRPRLPDRAMVEVVRRCNLRCPSCPVGNGSAHMFPDMPEAVYRRVIRELAPLVRNLSLFNYGEPLLHPQISDFVRIAKQAGIPRVQFSSNGLALTHDLAIAIIDAGLDKIRISLDGVDPVTYNEYHRGGDFMKLIENVRDLVSTRLAMERAKPEIELQCIIMAHNEDKISEFYALAHTLCVDAVTLKTFNACFSGYGQRERNVVFIPRNKDYSRYDDAEGTVIRSKERFIACSFPWRMVVVNADGTLVPCCYDFNCAYPLGQVHSGVFDDWWFTPQRNALQEAMASGQEPLDICQHCPRGIIKLRRTSLDQEHKSGDSRCANGRC